MSAGPLRRLWWRICEPFEALWCRVVGHRWNNIKNVCRDRDSRDAKELAALYYGVFGSTDYCRRCGVSRGEYRGDDDVL